MGMNRRTLLKLLPLSALATWLRPGKREELFDNSEQLPRTVKTSMIVYHGTEPAPWRAEDFEVNPRTVNTNPQVWVRLDPDGKSTIIHPSG